MENNKPLCNCSPCMYYIYSIVPFVLHTSQTLYTSRFHLHLHGCAAQQQEGWMRRFLILSRRKIKLAFAYFMVTNCMDWRPNMLFVVSGRRTQKRRRIFPSVDMLMQHCARCVSVLLEKSCSLVVCVCVCCCLPSQPTELHFNVVQ